MTLNLNEAMTADELNTMTRSWLAWSATNIVFARFVGGPKLLLGLRAVPAQSIPEPGDYALVGGFNTILPSPAMFADVANAHLKAQLGLEVSADQCGDFMPCEYPMEEISAPLKTPNGALPIKRVAFDRLVLLEAAQVAAATPMGKLKAIEWVDGVQFETLVGTGKLSFPFQIDHVREGFRRYDRFE